MTVVRHPGRVNVGDGLRPRFVLRFVEDCTTRLQFEAPIASRAADRGSELVRERKPDAVWLLDADRTAGGCYADSPVWRPLGRAAADVDAGFVAWTGEDDDVRE